MNLDELKEYLGKIDYSSGRVACFGMTPWDYWSRHKFDHNQRKIRKGYPYLSKRAHIYINKYIKENRLMYMDDYLYDIWAKDCYCKCQNAKEKKRIVRERKEEERERRYIQKLIQRRRKYGIFESEFDRLNYERYKDEGKIPKTAFEKYYDKYFPIAFVALIGVGIILFVVYIGSPIYVVLSVIFCIGTVFLGLTGHGR